MQPISELCSNCRIRHLCITHGLNHEELSEVETIVKHPHPIQKPQRVYSIGNAFSSVYVVKSGSIKSYVGSLAGEQQITNFYLPGDVFGLDGVMNNQYNRTTEAMEMSCVCEIPFDKLEALACKFPPLHHHLNQAMGKEFLSDQQSLLQVGKMNAEQKIASFLYNIADKFHTLGLSHTQIHLPMSRTDIANFLGMAVETVSRQITIFQEQCLIKAMRSDIEICEPEQLKHIANFEPAFERETA